MLPATTESTKSTSACIEALRELETLIQSSPKLEVRPLNSLDELRKLHEIDADAYQECSISFDCFRGWWERYPSGITAVFSGDELVASIGLWAISPEQSQAFIDGQIREADINPVTTEECERQAQSHWYASGIVLRKHLRGTVKTNPIKLMLEAAIGGWFDTQMVAYPLRILALGEYLEGQNILSRFNFMKIRDRSNLPDGCDMYCLQANTEEEIERILRSRHLW
jgi:hypothetical protein